jgi:hypothetical protein
MFLFSISSLWVDHENVKLHERLPFLKHTGYYMYHMYPYCVFMFHNIVRKTRIVPLHGIQ